MSTRELDRLQVLGRVADRRLTQREAAVILGLTDRQLRRIWKRYQAEGAAGLVSKRRGRPSNRKLPNELRAATEKTRTNPHRRPATHARAGKMRRTLATQRWKRSGTRTLRVCRFAMD